MSRRDYVRPYRKWAEIMTLDSRDLELLDEAQHTAVDGVAGGTYAPTTPIVFGGAGLKLAAGSLVGTPVVGRRGAVAWNAHPAFQTPKTRTVLMPLLHAQHADVGFHALRPSVPDYPSVPAHGNFEDRFGSDGYGVRCMFKTNAAERMDIVAPIPPAYLHDGAKLSKVRLRWRAANTAIPQTMPAFQVLRGSDFTQWDEALNTYESGVVVSLDTEVVVYPVNNVGARLKAVVSGTTDGVGIPVVPSTVGATFVDGTVTWEVLHVFGMMPLVSPFYWLSDMRNTWLGGSHRVGDYMRLGAEYFRCTVAGSSSTQPTTWPTTTGDSLAVGTSTWVCAGKVGCKYATGVSEYQNVTSSAFPEPQWIELDTAFGNVIDASDTYSIRIMDAWGANAAPGNIYYSVELTFTDILDLRFA